MTAIQTISNAISNCVRRFGVTVISLCGLFLTTCFYIYNPSAESIYLSLFIFFLASTLTSVMIHLWTEKRGKSRWEIVIWILSYVIISIISFVFWKMVDGDTLSKGFVLTLISMFLGVVTAIFMMPALGSEDDIPIWNFTVHFFKCAVIGVIVAMMIFIVSFLILWSIEILFDVNFSDTDKVYLYLASLCFVLIAPMMTLGRLPKGTDMYATSVKNIAFIGKVIRLVAVPLMLIYVAVLYVYIVSIIVQWQLPDGNVSWMTIAMMTCCVAIEAFLYPVRKKENAPIDEKIAIYLPLLMLPVLILMSVGIIRRFADYGVTTNRLYLLTMNIWLYVVCFVLAYKKSERLCWIPISFVLIFMATSILPLNYSNISKKIVHNEIEKLLVDKYNQSLPLDIASYDNLLKDMPYSDSSFLNDKLKYLKSEYGIDAYSDIVYVTGSSDESDGLSDDGLEMYYGNYAYTGEGMMVPEGSRYMKYMSPKAHQDDDGFICLLIDNGKGISDSVKVDPSLIDFNNKKSLDSPITLETANGNHFVIDSFDYHNMLFSGYYFSK